MLECCEIPTHLCRFPTELLITIFEFLSAKNLINCRRVCKRWKEVIDHVSCDDKMWEKYCERDYKTLYIDAKKKSRSCRHWFDLYRSLSLWGRLSDAVEFQDEFCLSSVSADAIQNVVVLNNGRLSVHKRGAVVYYNLATLEVIERTTAYGDFKRLLEYDDTTIVLGTHLHLRIIRKVKKRKAISETDSSSDGEIEQEEESMFYNVKCFLTVERDIYFVNVSNDIFYCNVDTKLTVQRLPRNYTDNVFALSFCNGCLHMLTAERNVYSYKNNTFVKLFNLESKKNNIFDCLWQYGFLENIEWRWFFCWLYSLQITIPEGPLKFISMMKIYGDLFFIGCMNGVLLIYYKPYVNGHLDFLSHTPVKEYSFTELFNIPVFSKNSILNVDVIEMNSGHKVLVATPKQVVIITYVHSFR